MTTGTAWAGTLVVTGMTLLSTGVRATAAVMAISGGVALVAAGEFVFLAVVADRVCPVRVRRVPDALLAVARWAFYIGVAVFALSWLAARWRGGGV